MKPNAWFPAAALALTAFAAPEPANGDTVREIRRMLHGNLGRNGAVVVFIGVNCPIANKYLPRLNEMAAEFEPKGIRFTAFNSNAHETALETARHAREYKLAFDSYKDVNHKAADYFGAERTPEAFLLNAAGEVAYRGRIDDQHGYQGASRPKVGSADLENAIRALLDGKAPETARTKALGCVIARDYENPVEITYNGRISRIIQNRCQECHRPGAVAEFYPWMDYKDTRAMAGMIKEVVIERRMPPWHADPRYGVFANDRSMPGEEIDAIAAWVDAGCPEGDPANAPEPKPWPENEWTIGEPDMVIRIPEPFEVPAAGVVDYQYMTVDAPIEEDLWVRGAQLVFDTPAVHHIILFYIPEGGDAGDRRWVYGAAPGEKAMAYPEGFARKIPAGSKLLFEMHYTPTGKPYTDRSYAGLVLADAPPGHEVAMHPLGEPWLEIPAGDPDYKLSRKYHVRKDIHAVAFGPHLHTRGKAFHYDVIHPDGTRETILSVPEYDFNWQNGYRLAGPLRIAAGSTIVTTAHWDNSADNPLNPDPTRTVPFGDQTWDEMFFGFMDYYVDPDAPAKGPAITADPDNIPEEIRAKWRERRERRE